MKMLGQGDLRARAWVFADNNRLVRLRIGASDYLLDHQEVVALAAELVTAADQIKAAQ
jgi:hypothetical protein